MSGRSYPRWNTIAGSNIFLAAWSVSLVMLLVCVACLAIIPVHNDARATAGRHHARLDPVAADPGATPPELELPAGANPTQVDAGIYVDRIVELSIKDASWTVDFYLWFHWHGDDVEPGNGFQVVEGWIESQQLEVQHCHGNEHYERYRVIARITKPFEISRFPCDDHLLTINIENPHHQRHQLQFVPDQENSAVSSRVRVSAYEICNAPIIEKPHSYKTARGDPRLNPKAKSTYSQCRLGIELRRDSWGFYFKMFQALYVAVSIALLAMFVKPTNVDPRFGLGIGGLFAAVANSYVTSSLVPDTGVMTVADLVNGIGIGMILLTVIQSTVSLYLFERLEMEPLSRRFDQVSFVILASGYVALNLALPLAAIAA
jgi:hypothetical protein